MKNERVGRLIISLLMRYVFNRILVLDIEAVFILALKHNTRTFLLKTALILTFHKTLLQIKVTKKRNARLFNVMQSHL